MSFKVQITHMFDNERISDLLITAFKGGTNSWARIVDYRYSKFKPTALSISGRPPAYGWVPLTPDGAVLMAGSTNGPIPEAIWTLDRKAISHGLSVMAEKRPDQISNILEKNFHTWTRTSDIFVQFCIFWKVVYG